MKTDNTLFLKYNSLFGCLIGASFIIASVLFLAVGKSIVMNPQLNNIIMMLTIFGVYMGTRKYRDDQLNGIITYKKALGTGVYILAAASFTYAVFIFILYTFSPDLMVEFKRIMLTSLKAIYQDTPLYKMIEDSFQMYLYPISIASGELFNKLFIGTIFTLFLAGLVKKNAPKPQEF